MAQFIGEPLQTSYSVDNLFADITDPASFSLYLRQRVLEGLTFEGKLQKLKYVPLDANFHVT